MQLTPVDGDAPIVTAEPPVDDPVWLLRQRERLVAMSQELDDETIERVAQSTTALTHAVAAVDDRRDAICEAPPGHVPWALVAQHAPWDAWDHERDTVRPLGVDSVDVSDEIAMTLRVAPPLGPSLRASQGTARPAAVEFRVTDPDVSFVGEVGSGVVVRAAGAVDVPIVITRDADALLEAVNMRVPFPDSIPAEHRALIGGLATVFDQQESEPPGATTMSSPTSPPRP